MNRIIIECLVGLLVFLEFCDESTLNTDTAVSLTEDVAAQLTRLDPSERDDFIRQVIDIARNEQDKDRREFLLDLPEALGIV